MIRSLALTGIALIAASVVSGCHGGTALADVPGPGGGHGHTWQGRGVPGRYGHIRRARNWGRPVRRVPVVRLPAPRRARVTRPGCTQIRGGVQCVHTQGFARDWVMDDGGDRDPIRSLIGPED